MACQIQDLKNNNERALKMVFDTYHAGLYKYVLDKTQSAIIADEVVQLTFIKLWKYRFSLKEDLTISTQIFRIGRTTMIDELRKRDALKRKEEALLQHAYADKIDEGIYYKEALQKLEVLIAKMPPVRQQVFRLSRQNNYSYKEIAALLSISTKTVENHISLALKFIKPFFSILIFGFIQYFGL